MKYPPDGLRYGSPRDIELSNRDNEVVTEGQDHLVKFVWAVVVMTVLAFAIWW